MRKLLKKTKLLFVCLFFLGLSIKAQGIYFTTGLNTTTYNFKGTDNFPLEFNTKIGSFYELGYSFNLIENILNYDTGIALNDFNSLSGDTANNYQWYSTYIGLNNHLNYIIIPAYRMPFELSAGFQLQLMHILNGEQLINNESFDLTKEKEFKGFWVQPGAEVSLKYFINDFLQICIGYNYSISINTSNSSEEKLKFNNQQLRFGFHFTTN